MAPVREALDREVAVTPIGRLAGDHPKLAGAIRHGRVLRVPLDRALAREMAELVSKALTTLGMELPIGESELNGLLRRFNDDPALLRRLLADEGLLNRDPATGVYSLPETANRP